MTDRRENILAIWFIIIAAILIAGVTVAAVHLFTVIPPAPGM